jgi:hypothetical protein
LEVRLGGTEKKNQSYIPKIFQVVAIPQWLISPGGTSWGYQPFGACEFSWNISQGPVNSHDFTIGENPLVSSGIHRIDHDEFHHLETKPKDQHMDSKMVVKYRCLTVPPS